MYSKSQAAFIMSAEKLFDGADKVYFWTFTFKDVWPDWYYPPVWNKFMKKLIVVYPFIRGLRVLEPAERHGLHYHCLLTPRMNIHLVKRIAKPWGFGRIHVVRCNEETRFYLSKDLVGGNPLWKGMRRWGKGGGFNHVKTCNIEVDSVFHRNVKKLCMGEQKGFAKIHDIWKRTMIHGPVEEWPKQTGIVMYRSDGSRVEPKIKLDTTEPF